MVTRPGTWAEDKYRFYILTSPLGTWNEKPEMKSKNIQSIVTNMRENLFIATNKKTWQTQTRKEGDGARLQCSPPLLLVSLQLEVLRKQKQ